MNFTETNLMDALRDARPGQQLNLDGLSAEHIDEAVRHLSNSQTVGSQLFGESFDLGPHISQASYWWGMRIELDHEAVEALSDSAALENLLLVGIPPMVAGIIVGVIQIIKAWDRGNGVIVFVTWAGIHWYAPR